MLLWPSVGPMEELMERDLWRHNSSSDRYNLLQPPALVKLLCAGSAQKEWLWVYTRLRLPPLQQTTAHLLTSSRIQTSSHSRWRDEVSAGPKSRYKEDASWITDRGEGGEVTMAERVTWWPQPSSTTQYYGVHEQPILCPTQWQWISRPALSTMPHRFMTSNENSPTYCTQKTSQKRPRWPKRETNQTKSGS